MKGTSCTRMGHIQVRIGPKNRYSGGIIDHLRANVGMKIKANNQGNIISERRPYLAQKFPFPISKTRTNNGAVEIKINAIKRLPVS